MLCTSIIRDTGHSFPGAESVTTSGFPPWCQHNNASSSHHICIPVSRKEKRKGRVCLLPLRTLPRCCTCYFSLARLTLRATFRNSLHSVCPCARKFRCRKVFFFSSWQGQASNSLQHSLWKPKQYLWWMQYSIYPDYGMFRMDRCMLVWAKLEARRCKSEDMCVCVFLESHMKTWIRKCVLSIALVTILPPALGRHSFCQGQGKRKFVGSWKSWVAESTRPEIQPCSTISVLQKDFIIVWARLS